MITMRELLERAESYFPANPAVVPLSGDPPLTWAEFVVRVRRVAGALRSLGVEAGDRFALVCRNDPRQAELIHAGYWMGAVPVPINYRLAPAEIAAILEGVSPRLLVVEDHWASRIADPALAGRREEILWIGCAHGGRPGEPVYEKLRDASPEDDGVPSAENDDALLLHTGGTTGRAKGVRLTHRNIVTNGIQIVGPNRAAEDDVMLHVAPMFHSADLLGTSLLPYRRGARLSAGLHAGCIPERGGEDPNHVHGAPPDPDHPDHSGGKTRRLRYLQPVPDYVRFRAHGPRLDPPDDGSVTGGRTRAGLRAYRDLTDFDYP